MHKNLPLLGELIGSAQIQAEASLGELIRRAAPAHGPKIA